LPRYKADQDDPGKTDTVFSFIHFKCKIPSGKLNLQSLV
jgi:hypothetical protein